MNVFILEKIVLYFRQSNSFKIYSIPNSTLLYSKTLYRKSWQPKKLRPYRDPNPLN